MVNLSVATNQNFAIHVDSISNLLDKPLNNALSRHALKTSVKVIFMPFVCPADALCSGYTSS